MNSNFKKYLVSLIIFHLLFFVSCKESSKTVIEKNVLVEKKVLLSDLSFPKGYKIIAKHYNCPEGEELECTKIDSSYYLKRGKSNFKISIRYFNKKSSETTNIDNRIQAFSEELLLGNDTFKIQDKKKNTEKSIWYINYTFGFPNNYLHSLYMERKTPKYWIKIDGFDNQFDLNEIEFLYNELHKIKD